MPQGQKGFAHLVLLILLIAGIGIGIYLVQHPTLFIPHASESTPALQPVGQTPPTLAFVFTGESNSGGFGLNDQASPDELAKTSSVQILNNYSLKFEDLVFNSKADPSTAYSSNNILDHVGISDHPADHGLELQLAKSVKAGDFPNNSQVYLVKTGQGGSGVYAWNSSDEVNFPYWKKFVERIDAAKPVLYQPGKPVQWVVWYSLGLNDNLGAPAQPAQPAQPATATTPAIPAIPAIPEILPIPVADYKAKSLEFIHKIKGQLPGAIIILTQFQAQYQSLGNLQLIADYNNALAEIAASEPNIYVVDSTGAQVNDGDPKHWSYAGFKTLGLKMVDATKRALASTNTISAAPNPCILGASGTCASTISWNFPGVHNLVIAVRENPGTNVPNSYTRQTGSQLIDWISPAGVNFDVYSDSGLYMVGSLFAKGVSGNAIVQQPSPASLAPVRPTGTITATPCTIPAGTIRCSSTIAWSSSNTTGPVQVRIKGVGIWTNGPVSGSQSYAYVTTAPITFELYDGTGNDNLLASTTVQGTISTGTITATPCTIPAGTIRCSSTIAWSSSNTTGPVQVRIKGVGIWTNGPVSGSQSYAYVTTAPITFELYDGTGNDNLLASTTVQGTISNGTGNNKLFGSATIKGTQGADSLTGDAKRKDDLENIKKAINSVKAAKGSWCRTYACAWNSPVNDSTYGMRGTAPNSLKAALVTPGYLKAALNDPKCPNGVCTNWPDYYVSISSDTNWVIYAKLETAPKPATLNCTPQPGSGYNYCLK